MCLNVKSSSSHIYLKLETDKPYIVHTIVGNNNHDIHFYSNSLNGGNIEISELLKEIEELKTALLWAKNQIKIKDLIIKQLI